MLAAIYLWGIIWVSCFNVLMICCGMVVFSMTGEAKDKFPLRWKIKSNQSFNNNHKQYCCSQNPNNDVLKTYVYLVSKINSTNCFMHFKHRYKKSVLTVWVRHTTLRHCFTVFYFISLEWELLLCTIEDRNKCYRNYKYIAPTDDARHWVYSVQ